MHIHTGTMYLSIHYLSQNPCFSSSFYASQCVQHRACLTAASPQHRPTHTGTQTSSPCTSPLFFVLTKLGTNTDSHLSAFCFSPPQQLCRNFESSRKTRIHALINGCMMFHCVGAPLYSEQLLPTWPAPAKHFLPPFLPMSADGISPDTHSVQPGQRLTSAKCPSPWLHRA